MHNFLVLLAAAAVSAFPLEQTAATSCTPQACPDVCPGGEIIYKTHTSHEKTTTCTTKTIYTKTHEAASTATTTLSAGCPTTTAAKRAVSSSSISSTPPIACPTVTCTCPSATSKMTITTTTTLTKTKTKTETVKTDTTTTATATYTPSVFYLQSTYDNTFATNDGDDIINFGTACSSSSTLYALNTTSSYLYLPSSGYIATNADCCGAVGLPVGFSDPSGLESGLTAIQGVNDEGMLELSFGGTEEPLQVCETELLLGASHLCDATTLKIVTPVFS